MSSFRFFLSFLFSLFLLFTFTTENVTAETNRDEVRAALEKKCDGVIWGPEITVSDFTEFIKRAAYDIFGGGAGAATTDFMKDKIKEAVNQIGNNVVKDLIVDGAIKHLATGSLSGGIKSYTHRSWTYKCCSYSCGQMFNVPCTCCCKRCGKTWTKAPNSHQPYLCWNKKRSGGSSGGSGGSGGGGSTERNICMRNRCPKSGPVDVHVLYNNGSRWALKGRYRFEYDSQYACVRSGGKRLKSKSPYFYYYAKAVNGSRTWSGGRNSRKWTINGVSRNMKRADYIDRDGDLTATFICTRD